MESILKMHLFTKNFLIVLLFGLSFNSFADSARVYCATVDGSDWEWLYEQDGSDTEISGEWGIHIVNAQVGFRYLTIPIQEYQYLQNRCDAMGMVAHPAENVFSDWYIFQIQFVKGQTIFAPGYYSRLSHPFSGIM